MEGLFIILDTHASPALGSFTPSPYLHRISGILLTVATDSD